MTAASAQFVFVKTDGVLTLNDVTLGHAAPADVFLPTPPPDHMMRASAANNTKKSVAEARETVQVHDAEQVGEKKKEKKNIAHAS